jgi:hypothetical protein
MQKAIVGTLAALVLAGCGGGGSGGSGSDPLSDPVIAAWNATDACALVSKADIAALLRSPVRSTSLSGVNADPTTPQSSRCMIVLEDGRIAGLTAYKSASGADAESRASQRAFIGSMAGAPPVDVAGLGEAAFWSPKSRILWAYFDNSRAVEISIGGKTMPEETLKADAVALARKAGGA